MRKFLSYCFWVCLAQFLPPSGDQFVAREAYAQEGCAVGEVMIGGRCRALGGKATARPAVADEPEGTQASECAQGEIMIGGRCRALGGKATARPAVADEPEDTQASACAQGEIMIGGRCRALGGKATVRPAVADEPEDTQASACAQGEIMIGGRCRALGGKATARPAVADEPEGTQASECAQGEIMIGGRCRVSRRVEDTDARGDEAGNDVGPLSWNFSRAESAQEGRPAISTLIYGQPETDNVQFSASCSSADGRSQPRIVLTAEVPRAAPGLPVPVRFAAPGFERLFLGLALQDSSDDGQQGGEIEVETSDPLWQALGRLRSVGYSVDQEPPLTLRLAGIVEPLDEFLIDCSMYAARDPGSRMIDSATQLFAFDAPQRQDAFGGDNNSCQTLESRRSSGNGVPIDVTFINQSGEYRVLFWTDFDGKPVEYARLDNGQSFVVSTFSAHPWMVTDGPGNCIERFMPLEHTIMISRKSPGFGDE